MRDLPDLLHAGDTLVVNDSKVIPARLTGRRLPRGASEGAALEVTLHKRMSPSSFSGRSCAPPSASRRGTASGLVQPLYATIALADG